MRPHHIIAIAIVLMLGFGVTRLFFSSPTAEANVDAVKSSGMDVSKMHVNTKLPTQKIHDMSLVFPGGD